MKAPEQMSASNDAVVKQMLDKYKAPMPNLGLSDQEMWRYLACFRWVDENLGPQFDPQPAAEE